MALATRTSPGEIQLGGDLAGSNDATAPELTPTGITAGQYNFSKITVDSKGRITGIQAGTPTELSSLLPAATTSTPGLIQAGRALSVTSTPTSGYVVLLFNAVVDLNAQTHLSTCSQYTFTVQVDFGATQTVTINGSDAQTFGDLITELQNSLSGATVSYIDDKIILTSNSVGNTSIVEVINDSLFGCVVGFTTIQSSVRGTEGCVLNADIASSTDYGVIKVGSGLSVDANGVISANIASTSQLGMIKAGTGFTVEPDGTLNVTAIPDATTTTKGLVQIGNYISVNNGVISIPPATNSSYGVVKSADTNNITITSNGLVNVGPSVAKLNQANTWVGSQTVTPVALTSGTNVSTDASLSNVFTLTLDTNATLDNPTNLLPGGRYTFIITQDSTGGRTLSYGSAFKFKYQSDNVLSIAANSVDILTCVSDGTNLYCSLAKEFV